MSANFYELMKYAETGIASPDMTYYDRMRASTLMGGATVQTLTGIPPLSFKADGSPLISWSMKGNGQQSGTPSPDNIIMPTFCGKLVGADWTIPITCAGQTMPVYLGQTQTVRRVKKLVFDGTEEWFLSYGSFRLVLSGYLRERGWVPICSHYKGIDFVTGGDRLQNGKIAFLLTSSGNNFLYICDTSMPFDVDTWKAYLASEYSAGHPVTVWYVLATEQTTIVNEPLCKIGTYADELSSTDAGVTIPTVKGQNTLTVETDLQPSEMTITYKV